MLIVAVVKAVIPSYLKQRDGQRAPPLVEVNQAILAWWLVRIETIADPQHWFLLCSASALIHTTFFYIDSDPQIFKKVLYLRWCGLF
jgi:hypothetical protein